MIEIAASDLVCAWADLEGQKERLREGGSVLAVLPKDIRESVIDSLARDVGHIEQYAASWNLIETNGRCSHFKRSLELAVVFFPGDAQPMKPLSPAEINAEIEGIQESFKKELKERKFAFIPSGKDRFFERDALFGPVVHQNFKGAHDHIKNAGNCLAADLNSAAVFHLMCVAEVGLRALSKKLKVKTVKKSVPIELGTWEDIIKALEVKVSASYPRTKKGHQESDVYKGVFIEYRAFKDFWRNKVMHTRADYSATDAASAFEHVRAFMQRLAETVSEAG
jgi:hypothetical protein